MIHASCLKGVEKLILLCSVLNLIIAADLRVIAFRGHTSNSLSGKETFDRTQRCCNAPGCRRAEYIHFCL